MALLSFLLQYYFLTFYFVTVIHKWVSINWFDIFIGSLSWYARERNETICDICSTKWCNIIKQDMKVSCLQTWNNSWLLSSQKLVWHHTNAKTLFLTLLIEGLFWIPVGQSKHEAMFCHILSPPPHQNRQNRVCFAWRQGWGGGL